MGNLAVLISHGGDGHKFGIESSVLALVGEFTVPGFSFKDGLPKLSMDTWLFGDYPKLLSLVCPLDAEMAT